MSLHVPPGYDVSWLSAKDRGVLECLNAGLSCEQIAREIGVSAGVVKQRVRRIKEIFRLFEEEGCVVYAGGGAAVRVAPSGADADVGCDGWVACMASLVASRANLPDALLVAMGAGGVPGVPIRVLHRERQAVMRLLVEQSYGKKVVVLGGFGRALVGDQVRKLGLRYALRRDGSAPVAVPGDGSAPAARDGVSVFLARSAAEKILREKARGRLLAAAPEPVPLGEGRAGGLVLPACRAPGWSIALCDAPLGRVEPGVGRAEGVPADVVPDPAGRGEHRVVAVTEDGFPVAWRVVPEEGEGDPERVVPVAVYWRNPRCGWLQLTPGVARPGVRVRPLKDDAWRLLARLHVEPVPEVVAVAVAAWQAGRECFVQAASRNWYRYVPERWEEDLGGRPVRRPSRLQRVWEEVAVSSS